MLDALAADIETVPLDASLAKPYPEAERSAPGNIKDPEKIAAWRKEDINKWETDRLKGFSLNPRLGRVVAIGYADEAGSTSQVASTERDEARLLEDFWYRVDNTRRLVTWNGLGFDFPYILVRSMLLGLAPRTGTSAYLKRYVAQPHYDVKAVLYQWDAYRMKERGNGLGEWAESLGLTGKVSHGSMVYQMYTEGRFADIGAYAADDAAKTFAVYQRVHPYFS